MSQSYDEWKTTPPHEDTEWIRQQENLDDDMSWIQEKLDPLPVDVDWEFCEPDEVRVITLTLYLHDDPVSELAGVLEKILKAIR